MYVLLLADSAQHRKGPPISAARELLNLTKSTKVFSGSASIQSILDELSQDVADRTTGIPIKGGSGLITADELASFFVADPRLIALLTDIWEYRDDFDYKLRSGSIKIKNLCVNLFAASNEMFLRQVYDQQAIYGGLLGRTFLIKPDETRPGNSIMYEDETKSYDLLPLVKAIQEIKKLNGPITRTPEAAVIYDKWYQDLYAKYKTINDRTGVIQRMHTNVLKVAMVLAAADYSTVITKEIIEEAILQTTSLRMNYESYVMGTGKSNQADIGKKFLQALCEKHPVQVERKEFLMLNWADTTVEEFDKMLDLMRQAGLLDIALARGEVVYSMTQKAIAILYQKTN